MAFAKGQTTVNQSVGDAGRQADILYNQAVRNHKQGKAKQAESLCRRAVASAPDHGPAHHLLATLLYRRGDHAGALEHGQQAVADQETESRRLVDFLGLPWDPACLEFHRGQQQVKTASNVQVGQRIYTSSVGRWRRFKKHLSPLLDELAPVAQRTGSPHQ